MDASVSNAKSRHVEVARALPVAASPVDLPVSKPPKALAPQVVSSVQDDEAPSKPVFVKRDKRDARPSDSSGSIDSNKRSLSAACVGNTSKKPLCSFEDE
jgi:hypothetical protein